MSAVSSYAFHFSISFAGPDRAVAEELAAKLTSRHLVVFYDGLYASRLLGRRLDAEFRRIFGPDTRFVIALISQDYGLTDWSHLEWEIAREEARSREDFILPLRLDDTLLLGLPDSVGYLDLRQLTIDEAVDILAKKHHETIGFGVRGRAPPHLEEWVATFGVNVDELLSSGYLPPSAPRDYPSLCDWLEANLLERLMPPVRDGSYSEASARNGETLSVRLAFKWIPREEALAFGDLDWWEVLEVLPREAVYEV